MKHEMRKSHSVYRKFALLVRSI